MVRPSPRVAAPAASRAASSASAAPTEAARAFPVAAAPSAALQLSAEIRTSGCDLTASDVGRSVVLAGWVQAKRVWSAKADSDAARPAFVVLRDEFGTVQLVVDASGGPSAREAASAVAELPLESCVRVEGVVRARPEGQAKSAAASGAVEVLVSAVSVLNAPPPSSGPAPLPVATAVAEDEGATGATGPGEDVRMRHRSLDLRRPRMQRNLRVRAATIHAMRRQLAERHGFLEVETPALFLSTPEGAREFIVPTRESGRFYALVQSPQQHKQMLMAGGVTRYFQVARCFRDEGGRADRQPEFTQLDMEMGFAGGADIRRVAEGVLDAALAAFNDTAAALARLPPPLRSVARRGGAGSPLPVFTYADCMHSFGSDRPLRRLGVARPEPELKDRVAGEAGASSVTAGGELPLRDVSAILAASAVEEGQGGAAGAALLHAARTCAAQAEREADGSALAAPPGSLEALRPSRAEVSAAVGAEEGDLVVIAAGLGDTPCRTLGAVRLEGAAALKEAEAPAPGAGAGTSAARGGGGAAAGRRGGGKQPTRRAVAAAAEDDGVAAAAPLPPRELDVFWVTAFPLFESAEEGEYQPGGGGAVLTPAHHPFTAPVPAHLEVLETARREGWDPRTDAAARDRLACVEAQSYDVVCDGAELGGGSVRMHRHQDQEAVFAALQLPEERIASFGHLLDALRWGAPPHAGIALGLDRFVAMLTESPSLRDVLAFPKTTGGQDLLSGAPGPVDHARLTEYRVRPLAKDE
ncbi:hypothetical protein FNF29_04650 [Cafeteria roenbergensis]|uniref:Aminoacyl-transfer RNA synthetases class-II family profile domain-containing protein n=1 Tax=Cafeteria roenbergensis TaxID=33653 RepID=A0A5A8CEN7_CAFRO|nr:hypothetical protein FNF29_04650 [Cafeteria roenbergensis]|eukprot:KAA0151442.1 hypothetical protein FNF29_04650 [Cafeteria roenbergensis]